jgi:NAD(P)-dependent dehydrogenase (short-subunit alcohol dehydrogenase family)
MRGKTCLVTGATSGIGKETALALARRGASVIVVGRNPAKGADTVRWIREQTGSDSVDLMLADLSSQQQVRQLAEDFKKKHRHLHVLVNNAGVVLMSRRESADGIEMTWALNHLGYFLLTNLLLDVLRASAPSRIVNVSSGAHRRVELDFADLQGRKRYRGFRAYARSKLANLLFTYELAARMEGTGVTVNALHPGLVATNLPRDNGLLGPLLTFLLGLRGMRPEAGARIVVFLAASSEVEAVSGLYFVKEKAMRSSRASYDQAAAGRLWQVSAAQTGLADGGAPGQGDVR